MTGRGNNGRLGYSRAAATRRAAAEALERRVLLSGSLSGTAWDDFDGDATRDEGEPALPGVRVYLDADNDAALDENEASVTTDAQGGYEFTGVPAGRHLVRQVVPANRSATFPGQAAPTMTRTVEGINFNEDAALDGVRYHSPAQPSGAVGPDHVVSVVNSSIEWHTKAGVQQNSRSLVSFFSPVGGSSAFLPKALYDPHAGRFVVIATEGQPGPSRILLGVSDDSDPNGTWHFAAIGVHVVIDGLATFVNYTAVGIDRDAIYFAAEMLNNPSPGTPVLFRGSRLWVVAKDPLYEGGAAAATVHDPAAEAGLPPRQIIQPATALGDAVPGGGTYLLTTDLGSDEIDVIRVTKPLTEPTFTSQTLSMGDVGDVPDSGFPSMFPGAPQRGTPSVINTFSGQVSSAVWRDGKLYAAMSVLPKAGPDAGQMTAHWVKIDASDPANLRLADQGNVGGEELGAGTFTFMPAVAVDGQGNMALGFAASGPSIYPGAYVTGRRATDPAGTVRPAAALAAGQDYYVRTFGSGRSRWGPYSSAAVDPADGSTFWAFNQYALTRGNSDIPPAGEDGRWGTRWLAFTLPDAAPGAHRVGLADGQAASGLHFGSRRTNGTTSGSIFHDRDGDGTRDEGEPGLAGRTVYLDRDDDGTLDGPTTATQTVAAREWLPQALSDYDGGGISGRHAYHLGSTAAGTITDVNVRLSITHSRVDDLELTLVSQDGTRVPLINRVEAGGANFSSTLLDDEAARAIDQGPAPYNGGFRPESPLSAFDGLPAAGTWRLEVHDKEAGETGTVTAWSLVFTTSRPGEATAVTGDGGAYSFPGLPFGSHAVRQVLPEGWAQTAPADSAAHAAVLSAAAADAAGRDFGSRPTAPPPAAVVGRHVFYGGSPASPGGPSASIAPDKAPLLPGQAASFANVTSYFQGINGVILDVANLRENPGVDDFTFERGDGTGAWSPAPAPSSVTRLPAAGPGGSDRVVLAWPDGAIKNTWLRFTAKANANTGLAAADVFSFGNLVGETGDALEAGATELRVTALDVASLKRALNTMAAPDDRHDVNRDGRVNALDLAALKSNLSRTLRLAPAAPAPAAVPAPAVVPAPRPPLEIASAWSALDEE